jgi:hypothetical protein
VELCFGEVMGPVGLERSSSKLCVFVLLKRQSEERLEVATLLLVSSFSGPARCLASCLVVAGRIQGEGDTGSSGLFELGCLHEAKPEELYLGGFAWIEQARAELRAESWVLELAEEAVGEAVPGEEELTDLLGQRVHELRAQFVIPGHIVAVE